MQYFKGTDAELAEHLRQGAADLIPYSLDEVESPNLNVALPAFLNEAADRLAARSSQRPSPSVEREEMARIVEDSICEFYRAQTVEEAQAVHEVADDAADAILARLGGSDGM